MTIKIGLITLGFIFLIFEISPLKDGTDFNYNYMKMEQPEVDYLNLINQMNDSVDSVLTTITFENTKEFVVVKKENKKLKKMIIGLRNFSSDSYK